VRIVTIKLSPPIRISSGSSATPIDRRSRAPAARLAATLDRTLDDAHAGLRPDRQ
jgi:hypothetical protein